MTVVTSCENALLQLREDFMYTFTKTKPLGVHMSIALQKESCTTAYLIKCQILRWCKWIMCSYGIHKFMSRFTQNILKDFQNKRVWLIILKTGQINQVPDTTLTEINNLESWAANNRMSMNLSKTWEMQLHRRTSKPSPPPVAGIERKEWLKLWRMTFHEDPCNWNIHIDSLLSTAASRLYILIVCKYCGYTKDQLSALMESLIMSLFLYGLEVWGSASQSKYLKDLCPGRAEDFMKEGA